MANTTNTKVLVNETLTKDEVMSLLKETLEYNLHHNPHHHNIDDYLSILKGEYTTWDNEIHMGYIVCHTTRKGTKYERYEDYYFMEVTLEEVENPYKTSHLWKPTFHKLMPITENYKCKPMLPETGNAKDLCNYIISNSCNYSTKQSINDSYYYAAHSVVNALYHYHI